MNETKMNKCLQSVAIIGGGPAGFYMAGKLLNAFKSVHIDVFEKLHVPFGLVRYGVAPDHPEVRNVVENFKEIAANPRVRVLCNVGVGKDLLLRDIRDYYQAVVLTYGAYKDKRVERFHNLKNVFTGLEFVHWYNNLNIDKIPLLDKANAVLIGTGNVALDAARILLKDPFHFQSTCMNKDVLHALKNSYITNVLITGRRGFGQASFKPKELRELLNLTNVNFECVNLPSRISPELPRFRRRLFELLKAATERKFITGNRHLTIHFLIDVIDCVAENNRISGIRFQRNKIIGDPNDERAIVQSIPDSYIDVPCDLLISCIGQHVEHIDADVPYNAEQMRVHHDNLRIEPGFYCAGWAAHGSKGTLADTLVDARHVTNLLKSDLNAGKLKNANKFPFVLDFLKDRKIKFHLYSSASDSND